MKRILIFSLNYYPRFIGGAEVAIKEITDRIPADEIEFHMVTLRFDSDLPKTEKIGNVTVHRIGPAVKRPSIADLKKFPLHLNKHLYQFLAAWEARNLNRTLRFDGIWAMMAHSCAIPAGLFKMLNPNVPYLLTLQEGDPPEHIERLARPVWPLFVQGFTRADVVQPISTFLAEWAKRRGARTVEVIPNAVETERFARPVSSEERRTKEVELGKRPGDVWLVTISRLVHKNAVDTVIRAVPNLPPQVTFVVGGIGPDEAKLRALAKELGVADRVVFLGEVSQTDLPKVLAVCDIFTRPSRSEGMGVSFIEAMASGLPVIATHEGGIPDFLFDEKKNPDKETTGWAVATDSPEDIVLAVNDILARPEKVAEVSRTARDLVRKKYDWDTVAADMHALFLRMMAR